ncbi:response regulator transcription factor [Anaerosacchariphilus polymeriproducens]|uniref:Stage 0 sporulation protein A homolog n=1 Tax=Anaerosacchariphilus polymeriproducens TaxID=1812858 RepID=A0A371AT33_9FIRM|nr:response regulator transcription factor [Anaerosacchariphilus polymeriproducens]RDU22728.1 DNA-binding response regulator [Anaerosacchariphilus polymeriproducens]
MLEHKILIIEDERPIADILEYGLKKEYQVLSAYTGADGLKAAKEWKPDLVLLDWMLTDLSGTDVCKMLTEQYNIPIIMITARSSMEDKLYGLEVGADDYITKPFDIREVLARIHIILRRYEKGKKGVSEKDNLVIDDITISLSERTVYKEDEYIELTPKEFDLLLYLVKHPKQVFTRELLLEQVWGYDYLGDTRTIDIHVQRLRKKVGLESHLITVFRVGYKYVP